MMDDDYINPDFDNLYDTVLCWKHYISPIDIEHWEEYPTQVKRMIFNLANNMMEWEIERLERGRLGR